MRSDFADVVDIGGARPVGTLPRSPRDGQIVDLLVDTAGTYGGPFVWRCKYLAATAGAYKWHVLGGPPLLVAVDTTEATAATALTDLATVGPSIVLPFAGDWEATFGSVIYSNAGVVTGLVRLVIAGVSPATDVAQATSAASGYAYSASAVRRKLGVAAGATAKLQYAASSAVSTSFANRFLSMRPLRIG